jgi:hypothetical protein
MIITFMDGKDIQFFHAERGLGVWPAANGWGGLRKDAEGTKRTKIWLAARVLVCSLRELWFYVTQKSRKSQKD